MGNVSLVVRRAEQRQEKGQPACFHWSSLPITPTDLAELDRLQDVLSLDQQGPQHSSSSSSSSTTPLPPRPPQAGRTDRVRGGPSRTSTSLRFSAKAVSARYGGSEEALWGDVYTFTVHNLYNYVTIILLTPHSVSGNVREYQGPQCTSYMYIMW